MRTGTVVAAANDLGVTAGAVSKQLAQLQHEIAAPLFSAGHRLKPTPLAIELAQAVNAGLRGIENAWIAASQAADKRVITIAANATLSIHWILPRLVDAEARMSGHPVRVSQLHTTDDWRRLAFDIAILRVRVDDPDYEQRLIGTEELTVLASPERARDLQGGGLGALASETFFVARTREGELEGWLSHAGLRGAVQTRSTPHFYIAVEAAAADQGCIIGPPSVLSELIAHGRLAAPFPELVSQGATLTAVFKPQICRPRTADRLLTFLFSDFG